MVLLFISTFLKHHCKDCIAFDFSTSAVIWPEYDTRAVICSAKRFNASNLLAIMNVYAQSEMYLCDFACVFEGEWEREREEEGFIALFVYARDRMNLSVCVWMNVDETEKAALCIAAHHRQYPCFSTIHIHTTFSYPLQKEGRKVHVFECTAGKWEEKTWKQRPK